MISLNVPNFVCFNKISILEWKKCQKTLIIGLFRKLHNFNSFLHFFHTKRLNVPNFVCLNKKSIFVRKKCQKLLKLCKFLKSPIIRGFWHFFQSKIDILLKQTKFETFKRITAHLFCFMQNFIF